MARLRTLQVGGRQAFAAPGYLGAKHTIGSMAIGLFFAACGAALAYGCWTNSPSLQHQEGTWAILLLIPMGFFALIGCLIAALGLVVIGATICDCLTSHVCWVDGGSLHHASTLVGWKRIRTFPASGIADLGASVHARIAPAGAASHEGDILYQIEVRVEGRRLHIPLLKSLREDEADICLTALRRDLGLPEKPWSPRQIGSRTMQPG
ncbi:MAG: hypothetical protein H0V44_01050 [Planctomycetes bacterium]|nr:hypothetical protein [Planctomycetota bacterium]